MLRRLLRSAALSLVLNLTTKGANVVAFTVVARLAGPGEAGVFSLATTYLLIFSAITWGLDELLIRQVARDRSVARTYFKLFVIVRGLACLALTLALAGWLAVLRYPVPTTAVILLMGLSLIPDGLGNVALALLMAHERFEPPVAVAFAVSAVKLIGLTLALASGTGLVGVAWVWLLGNALGALLLVYQARRLTRALPAAGRIDWAYWKGQVRLALPFLLIGFLLTLEYQTDVILLSVLRGEVEVGWYGATTTVTFALMLVPQAYRVAVFPRMAEAQRNEPTALTRLYQVSFQYLAAVALPAAIGISLLSPRIIELIYGPAFEGAVQPLRLMAWSLIFLYLTVPNSRLLLVQERQNWLAGLLVASMGLNIVLNLALIPSSGASGAALARLCSAAFFFLCNYVYILRNLQTHSLVRALAPSVLAGVVMAACLSLVLDLPLWFVVPAGALVYLGLWFALESLLAGKLWRLREVFH